MISEDAKHFAVESAFIFIALAFKFIDIIKIKSAVEENLFIGYFYLIER